MGTYWSMLFPISYDDLNTTTDWMMTNEEGPNDAQSTIPMLHLIHFREDLRGSEPLSPLTSSVEHR
jgi:hypothetical protein